MPASAGGIRARYNPGMEKHLHDVSDLSTPARSAIEGLLGHTLQEGSQVYVVALDPAAEGSVEDRRRAWQQLEQLILIDAANQHSRQSGAAADEVASLIDETLEQVRYGNKPCA